MPQPRGTPTVLDGYETIKKLGQGTYGLVFLCREKLSGKQCVMKRMQLGTLSERERRSALQEAQLLRELQHPNIVAYVNMHVTRSKLFLMMQYCDGGDLEQRLAACKKSGQMIVDSQLLDWFVQMSLALQYLHERRILHRDLKTANVFLTRSSIVKLGDFGVSRVLSATAELAKTFVGTPYYLSPELLSNLPYGPASDVWALGCIFYEIATLEHPFDAKNFPQLATKIINTEPEPISSRRPPMPGRGDVHGLDVLFSHMIIKDPNHRAPLPALLSAPVVQRRMLEFVREADPTAPLHQPPPQQQRQQQQQQQSQQPQRTGGAQNQPPPRHQHPQRSPYEQRLQPPTQQQPRQPQRQQQQPQPQQPHRHEQPMPPPEPRRAGSRPGSAQPPPQQRAYGPPSNEQHEAHEAHEPPPPHGEPRKRGKRRAGGFFETAEAGAGGATVDRGYSGSVDDEDPAAVEARLAASIEREQARLERNAAALQAADELAATLKHHHDLGGTFQQWQEAEAENSAREEEELRSRQLLMREEWQREQPGALEATMRYASNNYDDDAGGGGGDGDGDGSGPPAVSRQVSTETQVAAALEAAAAVANVLPRGAEPSGLDSWAAEAEAAEEAMQASMHSQMVAAEAAQEHEEDRHHQRGRHHDDGYQQEQEEEEEGQDEFLESMRVPSTLRLLSVAERVTTLSAADLPSPVSSPARGGAQPGGEAPAWGGVMDAGAVQQRQQQWRLPPSETEETWKERPYPPTPATPASPEDSNGGGGGGGGYEEDGYDENYDDDEFETDEDEADDAEFDDEDDEDDDTEEQEARDGTANGGGLAATLPDARHGGGGPEAGVTAGSTIHALEATLRRLQIANDEQAVVQDEVEALSGTLRAVAETIARDSIEGATPW